jgi:hypothetical protein
MAGSISGMARAIISGDQTDSRRVMSATWPELVWGFLCQADFIMRVPDFVGAQSRP